jgi:hypothetical protein
MLNLSYDDKIELMKTINWDYLDTPEDMLLVIEGSLESSGAFERNKLFLRSMERLPWHYFFALWGKDNILALYNEDIANRLWPKERKKHYDYAIAVLRGEALPAARWGDEYYKQMWRPFLSNRWYSTK